MTELLTRSVRTAPARHLRSALAAGLGLLALLAPRVDAQPGLALDDPGLAIARDSSAPVNWREAIDQDASLVVPWFGSSAELPADEWRTLVMVLTGDPAEGGAPLFHLRYNPAQSAVEMLTEFAPRIVGREPTPGDRDERILGSIRVEGVPLEADRNHCAVFAFDEAAGTYSLHVASQGDTAVRSAQLPALVAEIPPMGFGGRVYIGTPYAGGASHTGPIFPTVFRFGLIDQAALAGIWQTPGGPRLTDLTGPAESIGSDVVFLLLATGSQAYTGPAQDGRANVWYDGDLTSWTSVVSERRLEAFRDGVPVASTTAGIAPIRVTPVFEPDQPWSGWWQLATPQEEFKIGLDTISGYLPRFNALLGGGRVGPTALTAWGLGNSRWSNTSPIETSLVDPAELSRSHLLGLRVARPDRDGGLVVLNMSAIESVAGIDFAGGPGPAVDVFSNWTRFCYGASFASSPGNGTPGHMNPGDTVTFTSDLVGDPADPAPTQSLAILLERPRGGSVTLDMYIADSDGTGRIETASASPLPGTPADGVGTIDTDTTRVELLITAVTDTSITVAGDTSLVEPGDTVVGEVDSVVSVVDAVNGQTIELKFPWTAAPEAGTTVAFGPAGFRVVGFTYDAPAAQSPRRGLRIAHAGGGRITLVGLGLRSLDPNRICYILAGRGGLGQSQQAEREAPGTLAAMADALGVELFFTGLATQSEGTLPALEAQLGDRLLTHEFIGTPDVVSAQAQSLVTQNFAETHAELRDGARRYDAWAYIQIQDDFPAMLDQYMALWRHDAPHPNGRGMVAAGELWWDRVEALAGTLLTNNGCPADINRDGMLSPQDFNAWILAYNTGDFAAEQNGDAAITPADFNGWVVNFGAGCP